MECTECKCENFNCDACGAHHETAQASNSRLIDGLNALINEWGKQKIEQHGNHEKHGNQFAAGRGDAYGICAEQLKDLIKII